MTIRHRPRGPDYWTPLVRLTEALTMLEMAQQSAPNDRINGIVRDLNMLRELLLGIAKHPRSHTTTTKGTPT